MNFLKKETNRSLILNGNMLQAVLSIAVPVALNSFLQTMYNLTDTYWLGKIGTEQLAAINLVTPVQNIILNFGTGITVAGSVLIAQYIGAGDDENAKGMANQIFTCAILFAFTCAAICFFVTPAIVGWLGADGNTYDYGNIYLRIVVLDMPLLYTINIYNAIHQAQGDTVRPMLLNFLGIVINMILDPLFMLVLDLNIMGAALATLAAKLPSAIIAFYALTRPSRTIHIDLRHLKFEKEKLMDILKVGLPTAIGGSTMQLGFLLMSKNVYKYGTEAMAAYGIGNKVNSLITLPTNGIGSAVATIVGQNVGAEQYDRAEKGYKLARNISILFLLVGGMILSFAPISKAIVGIFSDDDVVVAMAADFLSIMAFWCWTNGIYNSSIGLFQGTGHTEVTMLVDISRLWVFRFLTLFLFETVFHMAERSIWYSVVVSNGISAAVLYVLYRMRIWRKPGMQKKKHTGN
ncbi:MAG: MATE family efflux transporter [Lachnospiraceae bacterium]|nr:MATE family efflux transporter [Lachnospiraceae bacterium]